MVLPEKYWALPIEKIIELAVDRIEKDGLFWMPLTRTLSQNVKVAVMEKLSDRPLYLHSPPPDWDHVLIDIGRLPDWTEWVNRHAAARFELKERGISDHKLLALPKGVHPREAEDY
ncbi:hypothetical protein [Rhodospirillum rubrum]|uniref:hypothetical protein n=1 Tax=Rhodospirillum rubrum TaxID=1085 RepID=UPI000229D415|nr:hypothetical protein [Rhodospirillum rubrum]AEO48655.1 hypothetical protein F11_10955 [Rhodospirillum rubrum F11]MBK5954548.1 hypothetical protein [Rhodospirillum rubrum]QXG78917.1 hypothetical protein KUL73_11015 [Rhodospirillum rubrum]HAP99471.1 hypothetical protein [Rhodospirillum rubrum]HCF17619.1 hypothetical protein [Rhodospirillum rubrum]